MLRTPFKYAGGLLLRISREYAIALGSILALIPALALSQGLDTGSITLYPNNTTINADLNSLVTSTATETVTFGLPVAACTLFSSDSFKLLDNLSAEVPVSVEVTMDWPTTKTPCLSSSIRTLKVQFVLDATGGSPLTYTWDLTGRTTANDIAELPISEIANDNANRGGLMEPRVFAVNAPAYLVQSETMPPTTAITTDDYDTGYYPAKWEQYARDLDYTTSTAANWLFDRTSTNYRQAMRRGEVEYYREAYLSHEFYISKYEVTGANTSEVDFCIGGFDMGTKADTFGSGGAGCDSKYIYSQPYRLHLALTGDDSWEPSENGTPSTNGSIDTRDEAWITQAALLFTGGVRCGSEPICQHPAAPSPGFIEPYDEIDDGFTERKPGLALQTLLSTCQLTLDVTVCGWADTAVNNMHDHQSSNPDGRGNLGYLAHSWSLHEGLELPWLGELDQNYTNATNIVVNKTLEDGPGDLVVGNMIKIGGTHYALTGTPTENPNGTWNIALALPVTASAGDLVNPSFSDATDQDVDLLLWGQATDRAFSPWMQSMLADAVWEYYHWTDNAVQKQKAEDLLLGFGRAVASYGVDATRIDSNTKTLVESAFGVLITDTDVSAITGCGMVKSPYIRYVGSNLMATSEATTEFLKYILLLTASSDHHTPELLFQLSLAIFFETDLLKRQAMIALAEDSLEWFEKFSCTKSQGPLRSFAWQNKSDPFGTFDWVSSFAIEYSADTFNEAAANDGSVTEVITLSIGGGVEFANKTFVSAVDFEVTNLPAGMSATLTRTGATTADLQLTGTATANDPANNVADISIEIKDGALVGFEAVRLTNSIKADLAITFVNPLVTYSGTVFTEAPANDGSVSTSITIDLNGDTFTTAAGAFPGGDYSVTGLPATLAASLSATSNVQAVLTLTGIANPHGTAVDTASVGFTFEDGVFTTTATASTVTDHSNTFSIDFSEPALSYSGTTFNENASTNVGAISNSLTVTLSDDTFVVPGGAMTKDTHFSVVNVPAGLGVSITGTSATTAIVSLTGSAGMHGNGNSIADLTLNFLPAALTTTTAVTNVANASKADLIIDYVEPALAFGGSAFNENAATNNGAISNTVAVTLTDDTFVVPGGVMTLNTHYTVANLPAGLTPVVTGTSGTTATFGFSGGATSNGNGDEISNLGISFLANAFTNSISTANLTNATKSDFAVNYVEPGLVYSGMVFNEDAGTNVGSIANTLAVTLSEDTFVNAGGSLTETTHFTVANLPPGLTVGIAIDGGGTVATVTLSGMATDHLIADDVSNFTLNFLDAAFATSPAAGILDAMKMDIVIQYVETGIAYDFNTFVEANNDGSTGTVLNLSLVGGETFVISAAAMTESTHYTVANVPAGLTAVVTGTSTTTATLALTGNAASSSASDDVADLTLTLLDAAFAGNDASVVPNSSKNDLMVDFLDGMLSYSGNTFTEATANDGSTDTVLNLTLTADTFSINGGVMTLSTHYSITNLPAGLTAVVTGTSNLAATFALTGTAASNADGDGLSNLSLTFLDAAFGGGDAAEVVGSSKADLVIDFIDGSLTYSPSTFSEAPADDGSISTVANLTLVADSFVVSGGAMTETTHYTIANVPAGLTVVVTGIAPTSATVALTGNAAAHGNVDDVSNLTITFLDAAFVSGSAGGISGSSRNDLVVNFGDPAPPPPPPTGGSGTTSTSGEVNDLTVESGDEVDNLGTLNNLNNAGTVNGGTVKGTVTNQPTGVLNGVTLDPGTVVSGGTLTGSLKGSGEVKNALLDITEIEPGVMIGSGTKVTRATVNSVSGLDLTGAIRDDSGALNLNHPLFVDDDESELSALDLALDSINDLFGNDDSTADDVDGDGTATIDNPDLADAIVLVTPTMIETTSEGDGVLLNARGELTIINDGIKMTFAPSPADAAAFTAALDAAGASSDLLAGGLVQVTANGGMFAFHFSYVATEPATGGGTISALSSGETTFSELGSIADPANYRVLVTYGNGVTQILIPALHDVDSFEAWMDAGSYDFVIDSLTGFIEISDSSVVVFRGIPDYVLQDPVGSPGTVDFNSAIDLNDDGFSDIYFDTEASRQVIYGLPLQ